MKASPQTRAHTCAFSLLNASGNRYICRVKLISLAYLSLAFALTGCARLERRAAVKENADAAFERAAQEYIAGYLEWRPQTGVTLGLHEYDGRLTDASKESIERELNRLKSSQAKIAQIKPANLNARGRYDYEILRHAIAREIFSFE